MTHETSPGEQDPSAVIWTPEKRIEEATSFGLEALEGIGRIVQYFDSTGDTTSGNVLRGSLHFMQAQMMVLTQSEEFLHDNERTLEMHRQNIKDGSQST